MPIHLAQIRAFLNRPGIEGPQQTRGYIPCFWNPAGAASDAPRRTRNYTGQPRPEEYTAMGASGVTIGTGVDLGQIGVAELRGLSLAPGVPGVSAISDVSSASDAAAPRADRAVPAASGASLAEQGASAASGASLADRNISAAPRADRAEAVPLLDEGVVNALRPYIGLKRDAAIRKLHALPLVVSPATADALDTAVHGMHARRIAARYDQDSPIAPFSDLPLQAQAAIFSLLYQLGCAGGPRRAPRTWAAFLSGNWQDAAARLRKGSLWEDYQARRALEGKYLEEFVAGSSCGAVYF